MRLLYDCATMWLLSLDNWNTTLLFDTDYTHINYKKNIKLLRTDHARIPFVSHYDFEHNNCLLGNNTFPRNF